MWTSAEPVGDYKFPAKGRFFFVPPNDDPHPTGDAMNWFYRRQFQRGLLLWCDGPLSPVLVAYDERVAHFEAYVISDLRLQRDGVLTSRRAVP